MSRFRVSVISVLLTFLLFESCGSYHTSAILNDVETYIQDRPDSALVVIRAIDTTMLETRSLRAHYALLHAMALDKNWIDTTDVNVVLPAVEYYDKHPSGSRRAKAWYYLGRIQQNGNNRPEASISMLKAERYSETIDDIAFKGLVYQSLSSLYSQTHFHEEALTYSERAYALFVEARDTLNANASLFCMANDFFNLERYAEADSLYRFLIESEKVHPNLQSSLLCGYALSLVIYKRDYDQAVRYYEKVISSTGSLRNRNSWGAYAYSLLREGNEKRADRIFNQIKTDHGDAFLSYSYWKGLADAYSGDYESAYYLQKAAYDIQDDNVKRAFRQSAIKAQKDYLEEMNQQAEKESKYRKQIAGFSFVIFIVISVLLMSALRRRNRRISQEKDSMIQLYSELMNRTEEEKAKVRSQYIQMCRSHFSHVGRISEILTVYAKDSDNNIYKELRKSIQSIGVDESSQQRFEKMLDDSFDGLMTHFRESFPKRRRQFYQFVSYLFAGFDTTTICIIIPRMNKHNVHVEKSRLKQKIIDSNSQYKEQFLLFLA